MTWHIRIGSLPHYDATFTRGDLHDDEVAWWRGADVVFAHCTCFDDALLARVVRLAERLPEGALFACVSLAFASPRFELAETIQVRMAWGTCTVHVHVRTGRGADAG